MLPRAFLAENAQWLSAGLLLTFASSFGQTFFVSLFGAEIRAEYGLTHGQWGLLYTVATTASAALLSVSGGLADRFQPRLLASAVIAGYAALCLGMAVAASPLALGLIVFGLRFCGQGMMSHIAFTAMGRWFRAQRGRAMAIAGLGFSAGEALLPVAAVAAAGLIGWRATWMVAAALLLAALPALGALLARDRSPRGVAEAEDAPGIGGRHWSRAEALRSWHFWALTTGLLGPPLIGTSLFFQMPALAESRGWALGEATAAYPAYALVTIGFSFVAGAAVDRFRALALLPFYQLPMAAGALMLSAGEEVWTLWAALALFGATQGGAVAILGALWPELYGARHLGAIRGLAVASMVFATALGPGVTGAALDAGFTLADQFAAMAGCAVAVSAGFAALAARLARAR